MYWQIEMDYACFCFCCAFCLQITWGLHGNLCNCLLCGKRRRRRKKLLRREWTHSFDFTYSPYRNNVSRLSYLTWNRETRQETKCVIQFSVWCAQRNPMCEATYWEQVVILDCVRFDCISCNLFLVALLANRWIIERVNQGP